MKSDNMLDVLLYLLDHHVNNITELDHKNLKVLQKELFHAGFSQHEIDNALVWLKKFDALSEKHSFYLPFKNSESLRIYTDEECCRLGTSIRGLMLFLEQIGIMTPLLREVIIDEAMELPGPEKIEFNQFKKLFLDIFDTLSHEEEISVMLHYWLDDHKEGLMH